MTKIDGGSRRRTPALHALVLALPVMGCAAMEPEADRGAMPEDAPLASPAPQKRSEAAARVAAADTPHPDVFETTDIAVWDGKPSHGDVWIEVPDALQPERVRITVPETGVSIRGAMFVRSDAPALDAPIRLSKGAALALGLAPNQPATLTVTALRREDPAGEALGPRRKSPARIARQESLPSAPDVLTVAEEPPSVSPEQIDGGYVQVAEAVDPEAALRVQEQLAAASIPAEIQEDLIGGTPWFRVYADATVEAAQLAGALEAIRFTAEEQGSDSGTLIAELPNFAALEEEDAAPVWLETGRYLSRNEALAVIQRLGRRDVPALLCSVGTGPAAQVHRVFAGPAETDFLPDEASFCAGVMAADEGQPEALRPVASLPSVLEPGATLPTAAAIDEAVESRAPLPPALPGGPVRIRVGEATGGLRLSVPEPFSDPIRFTVAGVGISLPQGTPPDRIKAVIGAIEALD